MSNTLCARYNTKVNATHSQATQCPKMKHAFPYSTLFFCSWNGLFCFVCTSTPSLCHSDKPPFTYFTYVMCFIKSIFLKKSLQGLLPCPNLVWLPFCLVHSLVHLWVTPYLSQCGFLVSCVRDFLFLGFLSYFGRAYLSPFLRKHVESKFFGDIFMSENVFNLPSYLFFSLAGYKIEVWKFIFSNFKGTEMGHHL